MSLYHRDVYLPEHLLSQIPKTLKLSSYSKHALERLEYYGIDKLDTVSGDVIEVEESGGVVVKVLVRSKFSSERDLAVVIGFIGPNKCLVKTLWMNFRGSHKTNLNRERYVKEGSEQ